MKEENKSTDRFLEFLKSCTEQFTDRELGKEVKQAIEIVQMKQVER